MGWYLASRGGNRQRFGGRGWGDKRGWAELAAQDDLAAGATRGQFAMQEIRRCAVVGASKGGLLLHMHKYILKYLQASPSW